MSEKIDRNIVISYTTAIGLARVGEERHEQG